MNQLQITFYLLHLDLQAPGPAPKSDLISIEAAKVRIADNFVDFFHRADEQFTMDVQSSLEYAVSLEKYQRLVRQAFSEHANTVEDDEDGDFDEHNELDE